jgi:hypothetical protein
MAGRIASYAGLFVLGAVVGALGCFTYAAYPPIGLILALAGAAGAVLGAGSLTKSQGGAGSAAGGWILVVWVLGNFWKPAEGDWLLAGTWTGQTFLLVGSILAFALALQPWGGVKIYDVR